MKNKLKKEATKLLTQDIQRCIEFLMNRIDKDSEQFKDLTLLSGRFSQVKTQSLQGTISPDKKTQEQNAIRQSILQCIEEIDDDIISEDQMGVFISNAPEDAQLAIAVETFLTNATNGKFNVICNESLKLELNEEEEGERELIHRAITNSKVLIIIITPGSNARPLLVWESGYAYGKDKKVIYLTYFINEEHIHPVFEINKKEKYDGESKKELLALTENLMILDNQTITDQLEKYWHFVFTEYEKEVEDEKEISFSKRLFHKHFHQSEMAENISGTWYAKWTQLNDGRKEEIFETDTLHIWSSENRIRVIGFNTKKNIERIKAENSGYYPMEGVVSWKGWIALSYWSAGNIPICGTCLLKPVGSTGELLEGQWQGFTAKDINKEPTYTKGRVVWSKRQEDLITYFDESNN